MAALLVLFQAIAGLAAAVPVVDKWIEAAITAWQTAKAAQITAANLKRKTDADAQLQADLASITPASPPAPPKAP